MNPKNTWLNGNCTFIVGTKQTIRTDEYGKNTIVYPPAKMRELLKSGALPKRTIERSVTPGNPHMEWVLACLEG